MREAWIEVQIDSIFKILDNGKDINQGWSPQCKKNPSPSEDIWGVLKTTAIQKNEFWEHENKELPEDKVVREQFEVKAGDILLTCAGPRNRCGVACTVTKTRKKLLLSGKMYRFRVNERIMITPFMTLFLQSQEAWSAIDKMKTGGSESGLNLTHARFRQLPIKVAPLPEQKNIVAKIEQLFSELDNGIANLKKAQEQLKIYRQAVLKKAFEGELTKEWREKQTDLPSAEELLEQIQEERERHYEQQLEDWKLKVKAWEDGGKVGKKLGKPRNIKKYTPLNQEEKNELPILPIEWQWKKMGNVCIKIMDGTHFSPQNLEKGDFKYITAKNIKVGRLKLDNISYVSKEDHEKIYGRCDVIKGDVLYIKDGATTGKAVVNNLDEEFSLLSSVGVFRTSQMLIRPKYLEYFLNSSVTKNRMLKNIAGVAITRLTLVKLNNAVCSICSPFEQEKIIEEIESRLSVCDKVEENIKESLEKAETLRQSILKKAFEGKLLTDSELEACRQEEDWEPAAVLLERIKEEKEAAALLAKEAKKKARKSKKTKVK